MRPAISETRLNARRLPVEDPTVIVTPFETTIDGSQESGNEVGDGEPEATAHQPAN